MDVTRYVPSQTDRITIANCQSVQVVQLLLTALEIRGNEIGRSLEDGPEVVENGVVSEDWRVKLGEKRGLKWLKKLLEEIQQEKRK